MLLFLASSRNRNFLQVWPCLNDGFFTVLCTEILPLESLMRGSRGSDRCKCVSRPGVAVGPGGDVTIGQKG